MNRPVLILLLIGAALFSLTSCPEAGIYILDSDLVDSWVITDDVDLIGDVDDSIFVFENDGTGSHDDSMSNNDTFVWQTVAGILFLEYDNGSQRTLAYAVSGEELTLAPLSGDDSLYERTEKTVDKPDKGL